MVLMMT